MHRPTIALIAVALLVVGIYTSAETDSGLSAACLRVGTVMAILWFAQPQLQNVPRWLIGVVAVALLIATRWPKVLLLALPVGFVLWILSPGRKKDEGRPGRFG